MRKLLILLISLCCIPLAQADEETVNIKIKISGVAKDNKYFLCLPQVGCLSMFAAQKGKIYPVFHSVEMRNMYVLNQQNFRLHAQGLPSSCNVTVNTSQTITIYGNLATAPNHKVRINQFRCSVS